VLATPWKATISFVTSVRPSVRTTQTASDATDLDDIWYSRILRKSVKKVKYFTEIWQEKLVLYIMTISRSTLPTMRNFSAKFVHKIKIYILWSTFFFENRTFYEKMCINMVQPDKPYMEICNTCAMHAE
jgi:hypothetical protein